MSSDPVTFADLQTVYLQRWYYVADFTEHRVCYFLYREHAPGTVNGDPAEYARFNQAVTEGRVFTDLAAAEHRLAESWHRWGRVSFSLYHATYRCAGCGAYHTEILTDPATVAPTWGCLGVYKPDPTEG